MKSSLDLNGETINDINYQDYRYNYFCQGLEYSYRTVNAEKYNKFLSELKKEKIDLYSQPDCAYLLYTLGIKDYNGCDLNKEYIFMINPQQKDERLRMEKSLIRISEIEKIEKKYIVIMPDGNMAIGEKQLLELKKRKSNFDLWIDFVNSDYYEKSKGYLDIGKRKTLLKILHILITRPGEFCSAF